MNQEREKWHQLWKNEHWQAVGGDTANEGAPTQGVELQVIVDFETVNSFIYIYTNILWSLNKGIVINIGNFEQIANLQTKKSVFEKRLKLYIQCSIGAL